VSGSSLVKQIAMTIVADDGDAQAKIADISAKGDELAKPHSLTITADTGEASGEVDAVTEALARYDEATAKAAEASERLAQVQGDDKASAAELSAAVDQNTEATLRALDAQIRLGEAELSASAAAKEAGDAQEESAAKTEASGGALEGMGEKAKVAFLGVAVGAGYAIDQAMKFQAESTALVTGAGELDKNLGMVKAGMLGLSAATATSLSQMESGMYMIESAGFHGAQGLDVLKAAAEGAKVGEADLGDVANALTSIMNAYHLPASQAVAVTNELVATVASGKMHMQDLAASISAVLPVAASAHISFAQVGGALATMTMQGVSAHRASQNLATTIRSLLSPSATASTEMKDLGLSANDVSEHLGQRGLTGTLALLTEAILKNSKDGTVLASTFSQLSPQAKGFAEQLLAGSVTSKQWSADLQALSPQQAHLATQFATTAESATGMKQTYDAALKTMVGGAQGLNTVLELTGSHMGVLKENVGAVGDAARTAGKDVNGWAEVQGDAEFKLQQTEISAKDAATAFGDALLPAVEATLGPISSFADFLAHSTAASTALAVVVGGALSLYLGSKLVSAFSEVKSSGEQVISMFGNIAAKLGLTKAATAAQAAETEAMTAAQEAQTAATEEGTVAQEGLDVAMDANPIGLIILGITALIGVIILVVTHLKDFETWGKEAFHDVEQYAEDAYDWVKDHWPLILAILTGPVGLAVLAIKDHWNEIVTGAEDAIHNVEHWFEELPGFILHLVVGYNMLLFHAGAALLEGLVHGIESVVGEVISTVVGVGHSILHGIEGALGISSPSKEMRTRGMFAAQGLALGLIDGMPLVMGASHQLAQATLAGYSGGSSRPVAGAAGTYGATGGDTVNLTVNGFVGNESQLATQMQQALRTLKRRNGGAPLGLD
jgi:TP901 family phage tail tape measure protein